MAGAVQDDDRLVVHLQLAPLEGPEPAGPAVGRVAAGLPHLGRIRGR